MGDVVIVVGGGLAGLSAAHTVLERGGRVILIDKCAILGGNSTKATSGINGTTTRAQRAKGIADTPKVFYEDTLKSAGPKARPPLIEALTSQSASAVEWITDAFGLDLSILSRLGGHSHPRTHRGKEKFPGFAITYTMLEAFEKIAASQPARATLIPKARAVRLLRAADGAVSGVAYERGGVESVVHGAVILATGGYAADFAPDSLLLKHRPDLAHLPTTNGEHCTGDGIKLATSVGAGVVDMECVQVHPTGLVFPTEPKAKVLFLAAEALRGCGAIMLDNEGNRFCDELGLRDYVTGRMNANGKPPFRLILNPAAAAEIAWHCKHYVGRGVMAEFSSGAALASAWGLPPAKLADTFAKYNAAAAAGKPDEFGKRFFTNAPFDMAQHFHVAIVTPVLHYCMGGLHVAPSGAVLTPDGAPIPGLFAAGEVMGGVHGKNRLGGNSLLDCVVFGRAAGAAAIAAYPASTRSACAAAAAPAADGGAAGRMATVVSHLGGLEISIRIAPAAAAAAAAAAPAASRELHPDDPAAPSPLGPKAGAGGAAAAAAGGGRRVVTKEEVAKHASEADCWVIVNGRVLDVTRFLPDHPGGKKAVLVFAGKDASDEFNMLHNPNVIEKYLPPECIIGDLAK